MCTRKIFGGVFPADLLPKQKISKKTIYIVNLDVSSLPGSHWVLIYITKPKFGVYFDSSGSDFVANKYIKHFFEKNCRQVVVNTKQVQNFGSSTCGLYVCELALHLAKGGKMIEFLRMFSSEKLGENDFFIQQMFDASFKNRVKKPAKVTHNDGLGTCCELCIQTCSDLFSAI